MQLNNSLNTLNQVLTRARPADNSSTVNDEKQQAQLVQQQNKSEQANQAERFDVDQKTLLLLEQQQQTPPPPQTSNKQQSTFYDQPPSKNQTAVATYQAVDNIAQRASVTQSFGINLIA
jgi:hypothetical protein